jgi:hypothetical protein
MSPAQLGPELPEVQGLGSSGWREKAEKCPWKGLEMKGVRVSKNENGCDAHWALDASHCDLHVLEDVCGSLSHTVLHMKMG